MKKYTQLTCEQRYHIYLLNKQGYSQNFIAKSNGQPFLENYLEILAKDVILPKINTQ